MSGIGIYISLELGQYRVLRDMVNTVHELVSAMDDHPNADQGERAESVRVLHDAFDLIVERFPAVEDVVSFT